jgi:hypothetical protein
VQYRVHAYGIWETSHVYPYNPVPLTLSFVEPHALHCAGTDHEVLDTKAFPSAPPYSIAAMLPYPSNTMTIHHTTLQLTSYISANQIQPPDSTPNSITLSDAVRQQNYAKGGHIYPTFRCADRQQILRALHFSTSSRTLGDQLPNGTVATAPD